MKSRELSELIGKTFSAVRKVGEEEIQFVGDAETFILTHKQECCEAVTVEDICGDLSDLEGTPIVEADNRNDGRVLSRERNENDEGSFTWTFFRISTIKGTVVIRFYGSSNGYYSESADLYSVSNGEKS